MQDFKYLDGLIHNNSNDIHLNSDIRLGDDEQSIFANGIELKRNCLVIDGDNHIIDANNKARIFSIDSGDITLRNIVFKNAFSLEDGGAIKLNGGNLTIENCKFIGNESNARGSSLFCNINTKTVISNTLFINNRSDESGCIHNFNARLEIRDSKFYDNEAKRNASTIINLKRARLVIKNTVFKNNTSQNGGTILNFGKCEIFNSLFKANITSGDGAAISNQVRSLLHVTDSSFIENECVGDGGAVVNFSKAFFKNTLFLRNSSRNHAGAISNQVRGHISISDSTFACNNVDMNGGALINWGNMALKNSNFDSNKSKQMGGAIFNQENAALKIKSCEFFANSCSHSGGAIFNWGDMNLREMLFSNNSSAFGGAINTAKKARSHISDSRFLENSSRNGAAIFNNSSNTKLIGCEFANHHCSNVVYNFKSLMSLDGIFKGNLCENVVFNDDGGSLSFMGGEFKDNSAAGFVFYSIGEFSSIANAVFKSNKSKDGDIYNEGYLILFALEFDSTDKSILNKGILDVKKMDASKIRNLNIVNDFSKKTANENDFQSLSKLISENDSVKLNEDYSLEIYEADFYEGGIEITRDGLEIDGCGHTIDGAYKSRIFIINARDVVLRNIEFKNGAFFTDSDRYVLGGGAIHVLKNASLALEKCIFSKNQSNSNGGAIFNNGIVTSCNCQFIDNKSKTFGGAIYNKQRLVTSNDEFIANSSRIAGAIYNAECLKIENDILLEDNESQFIQPIYNAESVEESGFQDLIYDSSKAARKHESDSFIYLMDMIEHSNVITLDRDIIFDYPKDFYMKYRIDIHHDLVIDGANHTIEFNPLDGADMHLFDGANSSSLFRIRNKDLKVSFKNIVFKNCYSNGRDIIDNRADLTIENCIFLNCRAIGNDCLIKNDGNLKISNCDFSNNVSSRRSIIDNSSKLEMSNVAFLNNNSQAMGTCISNGGEADVRGGFFKSNNAKNNAGCIYNRHESSLRISGVDFMDNDAQVDGGVIYNYGKIDMNDSKFKNNLAYDEGGALNNRTSGNMKITNCEFTSNESKTNGGAIFNYGRINVENSRFIENRAKNRSGAIEHTWPMDKRKSTYLKIAKSRFKGNLAAENNDVYVYDGANMEFDGK